MLYTHDVESSQASAPLIGIARVADDYALDVSDERLFRQQLMVLSLSA